jgi:hypothetical protein
MPTWGRIFAVVAVVAIAVVVLAYVAAQVFLVDSIQ